MSPLRHLVLVSALAASVANAGDLVLPDLATRISPAGVDASIGGRPAIAAATSHFLVGYQLPNAGGGLDIWVARVAHDGTVIDTGGIAVATSTNANGDRAQALPSIAFDGTNYIVAWTEDRTGLGQGYELFAARVTQTGSVLDPGGVRLTTGAEPLRAPGIAYDGTNLLIVWREGPGAPPYGVWGLIISPSLSVVTGSPRGFSISASGRYPWTAFDGTNYVVAWRDERNAATTGQDVYAARVTPAGTVLDPSGIVVCDAPGDQGTASVAVNGGTTLISWFDPRLRDQWNLGSPWAARMNSTGTVLDPDGFHLGGYTHDQPPVVATRFGDGFVVTWMYGAGPNDYRLSDAMATRVSVGGAVTDPAPIVLGGGYGHEWAPTIAAAGTKIIAAWNEVGTDRCTEECVAAIVATDSAPSGLVVSRPMAESSPSFGSDSEPDWQAVPSFTTQDFHAVWGTDTANVFATSSAPSTATIFKFNGSSWENQLTFDWRFFGLWGRAPDDMWAFGWCGKPYHKGAGSWLKENCMSPVAMGVWGSARSDFHFVAATGRAHHYRDGAWSSESTGVPTDLRDLWGTSTDSVYAVGARGRILHWTGASWNAMTGVPSRLGLNSLWGTNDSDIFAVGDSGLILHFNGATWTAQSSGTVEHLIGVWGFDASHVYAVGQHGTILRYDGVTWTSETSGTTQHLNDVHIVGPEVWVVGDGGTILRKSVPRAPAVQHVDRLDPDPTSESSVRFSVLFDRPVTGVDLGDFELVTSGVSGAALTSIAGSAASYVISASTGTGVSGTMRLNVLDDDSITAASSPLGGSGTGNGNVSGPEYTITRSGLSAPTGLVATWTGSGVSLTWNPSPGASMHEIWQLRHGSFVRFVTTGGNSFTDGRMDPDELRVYQVRASSPGHSPFSSREVAGTFTFRDDPLTPGMVIRLQPLYDLRVAVNIACATAGLACSIPSEIPEIISASNVQDLREGLASSFGALGVSLTPFTDPTLLPGVTLVKAIHFQEIRDRLK